MVQLEKQVFDMKISLAERALGEKRARLLDALKTRGPHQQRELSSSAAAGAQSQPQGVLSALKKEEEEEALDYTNSTLIRVSEGLAVFSAYHDDRQEEVRGRVLCGTRVRGRWKKNPKKERTSCVCVYDSFDT